MVFWYGVWMGIPPRLAAFIFARELYTPTWGKRAVTMGLYGSLFDNAILIPLNQHATHIYVSRQFRAYPEPRAAHLQT